MENRLTRAAGTEYLNMRSLMRLMSDSGGATARLLHAALESELTERQSEMVRLYYLEQHSMTEMADMLGVNISTVSRTLGAAREKLRRVMRYGSRMLLESREE